MLKPSVSAVSVDIKFANSSHDLLNEVVDPSASDTLSPVGTGHVNTLSPVGTGHVASGSVVAFGSGPSAEVEQITMLVRTLASDERAAGLSVLKAVAALEGVLDDAEVREIFEGTSERRLTPAPTLRQLLCNMNLTHTMAPVNLMEWGQTPSAVLAAEAKWNNIEIEVALDSGSVVHIASEADTPAYVLDSSPSAKPCEEFVVGDGGTMRNLGQKTLNV